MTKKIYNMQEITVSDVSFDGNDYDYLLLAPNIEKRSRNFYNLFKKYGIFRKLILADFNNFHKKITVEQEHVFYNDFAQSECLNIKEESDNGKWIASLCHSGIKQNDRIAVDITGFSIPNIYQIMHMFKFLLKIEKIDVYYSEPRFYVYDKGYYDKYHTFIGERKCAPVIGYHNSGKSEDEILIIFLGFDGGLAEFVYFKLGEESQETLETLVVNGLPSYSLKLKDVSLLNNSDIINKIGSDKVRHAAANNPFSAYNMLATVHKQYKGNLLNICTIGSKPMALGACLFALDNLKEVKVTYPFYEKSHFDADEIPDKIWKYEIIF